MNKILLAANLLELDSKWYVLILVIAVIVFFVIKQFINKKQATTGKDKEKVYRVINDVMKSSQDVGDGYVPLYVYKRETTSRMETMIHFGCALFQDKLIMIPLIVGENEVSAGRTMAIARNQIGKIKCANKPCTQQFILSDRNGNQIISFTAEAVVTKISKLDKFNINQKEELENFWNILNNWRNDTKL